MMTLGVWLPGLCAVIAGLGVGALVVARWARHASLGVDLDMKLNDIDEQLDHMVAQLRDLEQQRERNVESYYLAQKKHYENEASKLLRERDVVLAQLETIDRGETIEPHPTRKSKKQTSTPESEVSSTVGFFAARPQLRGALWGAGTVLVLGGLYLSVSSEQRPRAPGASLTGNNEVETSNTDSRPRPKDPELAALMSRLDQNPNDVDALNDLTKNLLLRQMFKEASQLNERVLTLDETNVQARTYGAVLKAAAGQPSDASQELNEILREHPTHADGHFFRGMIAMQTGDRDTAFAYWAKFVKYAPPSPRRNRIEQMLKAMPPVQ